MAEDWPTPHHHDLHPLPRVEDLPNAWEGYDRERVQVAFDAFYRHIAQLDSTLRALESVEVFRQQAGDLRTELRALRAAGWAPAPRGYAMTPERSMLGAVPDAVPRIALEVIFLVVVAAVVAVAEFTALEIVGVMAGAVLLTGLVELIASRDRRAPTPIPAAPPVARAAAPPRHVEVIERAPDESTEADEIPAAPPAVAVAPKAQTPTDDLPVVPLPGAEAAEAHEAEEIAAADDGSGWAAFAEPSSPQPLMLMEDTADDEQPAVAEAPEKEAPVQEAEPVTEPEPEAEPEPVAQVEPEHRPEAVARQEPEPEAGPVAQQEPEPEPEPGPEPEPEPEEELEPVADVTEAETGTIARRRRFRRRRPEPRRPDAEPEAAPKHVRVLPTPETAVAEVELPPWERGFDDTEERR